MKILTYEKLMEMPEGTIYSEFEPDVVQDFMVKGETINHNGANIDFYTLSLIAEAESKTEGEPSLAIADSYTRWGMFEPQSLCAVYEKDDLAIIKQHIEKAMLL